MLSCLQHHDFLSPAQAASQFCKPSSQSYVSSVVVVQSTAATHPFPYLMQHHFFLATDHPSAQLMYPASQSKICSVVRSDEVDAGTTEEDAEGVAGRGGGVTGGVKGAGHPLPACAQHQFRFGLDQLVCHDAKPATQSNGIGGTGSQCPLPLLQHWSLCLSLKCAPTLQSISTTTLCREANIIVVVAIDTPGKANNRMKQPATIMLPATKTQQMGRTLRPYGMTTSSGMKAPPPLPT